MIRQKGVKVNKNGGNMGLKAKLFNDLLVTGLVVGNVAFWGAGIYLIALLTSPLTWVESLTLGGIGILIYAPLRASLKESVGE